MLELFVELLAVRVHLIDKSKERPQDMNEALGTLVYAAARIQVPWQGYNVVDFNCTRRGHFKVAIACNIQTLLMRIATPFCNNAGCAGLTHRPMYVRCVPH